MLARSCGRSGNHKGTHSICIHCAEFSCPKNNRLSTSHMSTSKIPLILNTTVLRTQIHLSPCRLLPENIMKTVTVR